MRWETLRAPDTAALIRRHAGAARGGTALDVGCGSMAVARALRGDFDRIVGVDVDPVAVGQAALRVADRAAADGGGDAALPVVRAEAERLPFAAHSFDVVYSYGALHHTRLADALEEVARVLAPGGVALLVDFAAGTAPRRGVPLLVADSLRAFFGYRRRVGWTAALSITRYRLTPAWLRHVRNDVFLTRREFPARYGAHLPGAVCHEGPGRVVVRWEKQTSQPEGTRNDSVKRGVENVPTTYPQVAVGSRNAAKLAAVKEGFTIAFGGASVEGLEIDGTKDQPASDSETLEGAEYRARAARLARPDAAFWVGVEGGVETVGQRLMVNAWVVIGHADGTGRSRSATFELPGRMALAVRSGMSLGSATSGAVGQRPQEMGIVSELSNGLITRSSFYLQPVLLALLRFLPSAGQVPSELRY